MYQKSHRFIGQAPGDFAGSLADGHERAVEEARQQGGLLPLADGTVAIKVREVDLLNSRVSISAGLEAALQENAID